MFWHDFVHLTSMEFLLKYWKLYLIIGVPILLYECISYKAEAKRIKDRYDKLEDKLK